MGYEVVYHYREKLEEGDYSEEVKTKTTKVGSAYEEVPLEACAAKVMAQLARRNILITDVEIYEFTKKKISFKEADDGILIKNRKFRFDDGPVACVGEEGIDKEETFTLESLESNPQVLAAITQALQKSHPQVAQAFQPHQANSNHSKHHKRPKRSEVFDPELLTLHKAQQAGLKFTQGKAYPIYEEETIGTPPVTKTLYTTKDDSGKEIQVSAEYFTMPSTGKLSFEDQMVGDGPAEGIDLWGNTNAVQTEMPSLR
jgi:hypothetical protein